MRIRNFDLNLNNHMGMLAGPYTHTHTQTHQTEYIQTISIEPPEHCLLLESMKMKNENKKFMLRWQSLLYVCILSMQHKAGRLNEPLRMPVASQQVYLYCINIYIS